jgi:hypothetical protein
MVWDEEDAGRRWIRLLHPSVLAVSIGVFAASVGFDLGSIVAADQYVYSRGAYTLIGFGLLAGLVGVVLVVLELASWPAGPDRRQGLQHLFAFDALMVWFVGSLLIRQPKAVQPMELWYIGVTGLAVLAAAAMHVRYLRLLATAPTVSDTDTHAGTDGGGTEGGERSLAVDPLPADAPQLPASDLPGIGASPSA